MLGFGLASVADFLWMRLFSKSAKVIEKGYEVLEHYHAGLILLPVAFALSFVVPLYIPLIILGFAFGLYLYESLQLEAFAHGSTHFLKSSLIGIGLVIADAIIIAIIHFKVS